MDERDDIDELHRLAEYRRANKILRTAGKGAALFGVLNVAMAIPAAERHPINFILLAISVLMLLEGLLNLLKPTAAGIIIDGAVFAIIGCWNIFVAVISILAGFGAQVPWGVYGVVLIGWGIYRFASFGRFARAFEKVPDPEALKNLGRMIARIKSLKSSEGSSLVNFRSKGFLKQQDWKGELGTKAAIFIDLNGYDVLVANKDDVEIEATGKVLIGKTLKVSVRIAEHSMRATMSPESYERYEDWKEQEDEEAMDAQPAEHNNNPDAGMRETDES
jgi:hypothetical protein